MSAKKKNTSANQLALKAAAKARRELEFFLHGKPIHKPMLEKDKTIYTRKKKHKNEKF